MAGSGQTDRPATIRIGIAENDSVRLLSQILGEMDYTGLRAAYAPKGRRPALAPETMFSLLCYGYMTGVRSSRKLEEACRKDIGFIWLLNGQAAPDHNTIARFRSGRLAGVAEGLFCQLVERLRELGEVRFEHLFLDGTKIEANANRYTFVWKSAVEKNAAKLGAKARELLVRLGLEPEPSPTAAALLAVVNGLRAKARATNLSFVYGSGHRKAQLQRDIEEAESLLSRKALYEYYGRLFQGRNSLSKTDTDATFMRLKEDHMRNGQLKPAYNVQIGVEGEYVVAADIQSERNDVWTLRPFLERLSWLYPGRKYQNLVADAGYESEENYRLLEKANIEPFVKPKDYEARKKRKKDIGRAEGMAYDPALDRFTCANGRTLLPVGKRHRKSSSGFVSESHTYACESCAGCGIKANCTKADGDKRLDVNWALLALRGKSLSNISGPLGTLLRQNRSIQVEGAFGVLKENQGFRRFLLRGKEKVRTEWLLLCLGYNIQKLHRKIQNRRLGQPLHPLKAA